jgi:hypothetical protein
MVSRQLHKRIRLALTPLLARPHPNEKNYTDERNIPPLNRIGDPDDILASVRVENGKVGLYLSPPTVSLAYRLSLLQILAETYQAMPSYRLCTAHGVTQLTEGLASKLQGLLKVRAREESRTADS